MDRTSLLRLPVLQVDDALAQELKTLLGFTVEYWLDKRVMSQSVLEQVRVKTPT